MYRYLSVALKPDLIVRGVENVDLEELWQRGIRAIILDVDNTLTAWRSEHIPAEKLQWIQRAKQRFKMCLLSNTIFMRRLRRLGERLGIPYVGRWGLGRKPFRGGVSHALALMGADPRHTAIIGDQVFADVLAGKRMGMLTILVDPVAPEREMVLTRFWRVLERPLRRVWAEEQQRDQDEGE